MAIPTGLAAAFSPDYETARARFRASARARGARVETYPVGCEGPNGDDLTIDIALLGDERPSKAVVVSSGLHGVEGFFGSAVQLGFLEKIPAAWQPPAGTAVVLAHALDPYGFAWLRRVNETNVDLNRNFLGAEESYGGSPPLYKRLDPWLNAPRPPRPFDPFLPWALLTILRHGMAPLKEAIAGGQYDYPHGLFFGGRGPSATYRILEANLPRWVGGADHVFHVDFHTGLGPWGTYKLLIDDGMVPRARWLAEHFGEGAVELSEPGGTAYHSRGDLGHWCQSRLFPDRRYDTVCAEFGTYLPVTVLAALRAENQAYHWGNPRDVSYQRAKRRLVESFAPASADWRSGTVADGLRVVARAMAACFTTPVAEGAFEFEAT